MPKFSTIFLSFSICFIIFNAANSLDQVAFLFRNQELCGNPFSDPQWIPVLDLCEKECKSSELCVENDELTQKCKKLPDECIAKFEQIKQMEKQARQEKQMRKPKNVRLVSRTLHRQ